MNLTKIDWSIQIFSDFYFFENFLKIVYLRQISSYGAEVLYVNALVMFDTKFCENRSIPLDFRRILIFVFFISRYQILKIQCVHEASSVRKPKSSNVLPRRKNFVKSVRKQYGNPDSHPFFLLAYRTYISLSEFIDELTFDQ